MQVSDAMTEDPVFVDSEASIGDAVAILLNSHVRHLPVLRDGVVIGILSDRDLRSGGGDLNGSLVSLMNQLGGPVTDLMSRDVISITPDRDLDEAIDLFLEHRVGALPVVDPGSDKLVGILSYLDLLRVLRAAPPLPSPAPHG